MTEMKALSLCVSYCMFAVNSTDYLYYQDIYDILYV